MKGWKKALSITMTTAIMASLMGCGGSDSGDSRTSEAQTENSRFHRDRRNYKF